MPATLPAPYYYGPDKYVRFYDDVLKQFVYWPRPMSSETGNYVAGDVARYLFQTTPGTEFDLLREDQLPPNVRDLGGSFGDDLQTMADQGNHISQSIIVDGGYSMKRFAGSQKSRRKGLAAIDEAEFADYQDVTETRQVVKVLETIDLDQQIHSTVGLSVEQFLSVAATQGILVPYLSTFNGRTIEQAAKVSLATFVGAIMPLILAQLPTQTSPTNPTNPTKVLKDFSRNGPDRIIEGIMDTQYRVNVIYSDGTSGVIVTQGKDIDGFIWDIPKPTSQGEQISVTGICPIHPNDVYGDGRTFVLELRHVSLDKVDRSTIQIVDGTTAPPPPATTDSFIELLIDVDARSIRVRYRLKDAVRSALIVYRDGVPIYSADNQPASLDTSLSQTVSPGVYYALAYEPNNDPNRKQSDPQTIKGTPAGSSVVTAIDCAHLAKGADGFPQLNLWFKTSVVETVYYTFTTEDLPESGRLNTTAISDDSNGYSRSTFISNVRGNYLVTVKAWTESNQAGAISKQFRISAGQVRTTVYGAGATNPPVDTATIIQALDTEWAADRTLMVYGKTSRADGMQLAVANDQGQYSGWFTVPGMDGDTAGYQYKSVLSSAPAGSSVRIRYRPTSNNAESAIAYLTLTTPGGAQARKTEWANGTQIQPVSGDFSIAYADSNLGGGPVVIARFLPIWNADGSLVTFRRIYTGQIYDGYQEYFTFNKEGLAPDISKAVNPYQGRDIEGVIWFPPNFNLDLEYFWAKGPEVNRGFSYGYCAAIGKATIYTGTKPQTT